MFSPKEKFNVVVFGKCRDRTFDEFNLGKKKKKMDERRRCSLYFSVQNL